MCFTNCVNFDRKGQGHKESQKVFTRIFHNPAYHKKNVKACFARGNKDKTMKSVNKVNKPSDIMVKKIGHCKNNQLVAEQMNGDNMGIQQISGNMSNYLQNGDQVEEQSKVSNGYTMACSNGPDMKQKVGGLNKGGWGNKQVASTCVSTFVPTPIATIDPINQQDNES